MPDLQTIRPFAPTLTCSRCEWKSALDRLVNLCPSCSAPVLVRYALARVEGLRESIATRRRDMWRWSEFLPLPEGGEIVSLGEGDTPLLESRHTARLLFKDESKNPTRSFKSRGMAAAVTMARHLGATRLAAPTAGNAGCALAAYGARAGLPVFVAMPEDTPQSIVDEASGYGAEVVLVKGVITDAAKRVQQDIAERGGFDLSTLKEPYRVEGKKIMAYELVEQLGRVPDAILYPTGGGTGLIGMWKAFDEMECMGWIGPERPRMYSIQSSGCAPIVRAFDQGLETAPEWESPRTEAWGLRVPRAVGDRLMLEAIRKSGGSAIAVPDADIEVAADRLRRSEGIDAGPEAGAAVLGYELLRSAKKISPEETVVVFNTGANKYR